MVWDQLSINRPHVVYILLGAFTSVFMLVSLFIKEKLYIGEASVATIFGIIFGPHAANVINPLDWGNTDQITLEFSRIVLVVQCFAVGVELPKAYMERHWKSVVFLLVPVMAFGWLITSLFVWWMIEPLTWLESLAVAACVTATDPVLASSVVGKGKFAKRVPKHLRDLLSAESGCNDGMAFPFIYLALYLIHYHLQAREVVFHWMCYTILYECVFGAVYGVLVGYIARHAIRLAETRGIIDRESFLVFYFVLALFCAGSGSMLGLDDLLVGFAAGVGFSNDGWFTEKTEESHVSNVIDLLLNLTYFVYFGTIIPWGQYNMPEFGLEPWRLVVIAILVIFFRRIPIMLALKPIIPDIKTWREALFAGHFGPIGVGAVFVAILARAELETGGTTPLAEPDPASAEYVLTFTIWPIVTFLIIASIIVHGSSIAVFTLGKRINTLTLTLSYTQDNDRSSAWMNRLPRIATQRSLSKMSDDEMSIDKDVPPGQLPPIGIPKLALRRQRDDEYERPRSRASSLRSRRRKKKYDGGPISQSAIMPAPRSTPQLAKQESGSDTLNEKSSSSPDDEQIVQVDLTRSADPSPRRGRSERKGRLDVEKQSRSSSSGADEPTIEAYEEGHHLVVEDEEGNVLETVETKGRGREEKEAIINDARKKLAADRSGKYAKHKHESHEEETGGDEIEREIEREVAEATGQPSKSLKKTFDNWKGFGRSKGEPSERSQPVRKRGPAHAYQFGNTIIVEDEDGEVIKKIDIPDREGQPRRFTYNNDQIRQGLQRMGTWVGIGPKAEKVTGDATVILSENAQQVDDKALEEAEDSDSRPGPQRLERIKKQTTDDGMSDDDGLRLTISRADHYGLTGLQKRRPGESSTDPKNVMNRGRRMSTKDFIKQLQQQMDPKVKALMAEDSDLPDEVKYEIKKEAKREAQQDARPGSRRMPTSPLQTKTIHESGEDYFSPHQPTLDASSPGARPRPRRVDTGASTASEDIPVHNTRSTIARHGEGTSAAMRRARLSTAYEEGDGNKSGLTSEDDNDEDNDEQETAAERRRRLAALGIGTANNSDSSDDDVDEPRRPRETAARERSESPAPAARRIQWGGERGRDRRSSNAGQTAPAEKKQDDTSGITSSGGTEGGSRGVSQKLKGFLKR